MTLGSGNIRIAENLSFKIKELAIVLRSKIKNKESVDFWFW